MGPGIICLLCLRDESVLICFRMTQWWGEREGRRFVGQNREENVTFQRRTLATATFHGTRCPERPWMSSLPNEPIFLYRHPKLLEPVAISHHHSPASLAWLSGDHGNLLTAVCPVVCSHGENALVKLKCMVYLLDRHASHWRWIDQPYRLWSPLDLLSHLELVESTLGHWHYVPASGFPRPRGGQTIELRQCLLEFASGISLLSSFGHPDPPQCIFSSNFYIPMIFKMHLW